MPPFGLLNLNKPPGITSRRLVDQVQRLVRPAKAGHAGTLDPLASGVVVVAVGAATRLIDCVQQMRKGYTGTFLLGRHSPTEDTEGEVTLLDEPPVPTCDQIEAATRLLVGQILQRPPAFSALKVQGRRAYDLARRGLNVELKPRPVSVYALEVVAYEYPALTLRIECGGGTYVRSLGRDLAESLGTAAVMSALVRTAVGDFRLEEAVELSNLNSATWANHLLPAVRAVAELPGIALSAREAERIRLGQTIDRPEVVPESGQLAATDVEGRLVAILVSREPGRLRPAKTFPAT